MIRPNARRQPGAKHNFARVVANGNDSRVKRASDLDALPGPMRVSERRIANWDAAGQKRIASVTHWRDKVHRFVRVGNWHLCDRCDLPNNVPLRGEMMHQGPVLIKEK